MSGMIAPPIDADQRTTAAALLLGPGPSPVSSRVLEALAAPGKRALVVVNGYFGDRLAGVFGRYGAEVVRVEGTGGCAADSPMRRKGLRGGAFRLGRDRAQVPPAESGTQDFEGRSQKCG